MWSIFFSRYLRMNYLRHQKHNNHKQLNITWVLKVQNSSLELEKDFKAIIIFINDVDKFKKKNYQRIKHLQKTRCPIGMIG